MNAPIDDLHTIFTIDFEKQALISFLELLDNNEIKDKNGAIIKFRFIEHDNHTGTFEAHAFLPQPTLVTAH